MRFVCGREDMAGPENGGNFPLRFFVLFVCGSAILWTLLPSLFCRVLPLDTAEAVLWGGQFTLGNAKHPPLSGYLAYGASLLFGHADFGVYLLSQLCMSLGFVYLYRLGREFFSTSGAVMAALFITFFIFYNWETPKFNANIPHLALWPMSAFYFYRAVGKQCAADWLIFGAVSALSVLSKYFGLILLFSQFCYVLSSRDGRKSFRNPWAYVSGVVFFVMLTPHLCWLTEHDFLPFHYVEEHLAKDTGYWSALGWTAGAVFAPLGCILLAAVVVQLLSRAEIRTIFPEPGHRAAAKYALFLTGIPVALLLIFAVCGSRIDSMWTYQLYLFGGLLVVAFWHGETDGRVFRCFARLAVIFALGVMLVYVGYCLTKSKARRHLEPEKMAATAMTASRSVPPLLFGDMWSCAVLQRYCFGYSVPVCVETDPADVRRCRSLLAKRGALAVSVNPVATDRRLAAMGVEKPDWVWVKIPYRAVWGREKYESVFFAVLRGMK